MIYDKQKIITSSWNRFNEKYAGIIIFFEFLKSFREIDLFITKNLNLSSHILWMVDRK